MFLHLFKWETWKLFELMPISSFTSFLIGLVQKSKISMSHYNFFRNYAHEKNINHSFLGLVVFASSHSIPLTIFMAFYLFISLKGLTFYHLDLNQNV
jgi:hypothetical protein